MDVLRLRVLRWSTEVHGAADIASDWAVFTLGADAVIDTATHVTSSPPGLHSAEFGLSDHIVLRTEYMLLVLQVNAPFWHINHPFRIL